MIGRRRGVQRFRSGRYGGSSLDHAQRGGVAERRPFCWVKIDGMVLVVGREGFWINFANQLWDNIQPKFPLFHVSTCYISPEVVNFIFGDEYGREHENDSRKG